MAIDIRRRIRPTEAVVSAGVAEELVLLNAETGIYYGLNPIGARIWQRLAEGADEAQVVEQLSLEFPEVAPSEIGSDIEDLITALEANGLIQVLDA